MDKHVLELKQTKHHVIRTAIWLATKPGPRLVALLATADANEVCMKTILRAGSTDYEQNQSATAATAVPAHDGTLPRRRFPMVEAALQTAERQLRGRVNFWLTDPDAFNAMTAPANRTVKQRSYAFRLLSSCEAHVVETLCVQAESFPEKGFLVGSVFVSVEANCRCLRVLCPCVVLICSSINISSPMTQTHSLTRSHSPTHMPCVPRSSMYGGFAETTLRHIKTIL